MREQESNVLPQAIAFFKLMNCFPEQDNLEDFYLKQVHQLFESTSTQKQAVEMIHRLISLLRVEREEVCINQLNGHKIDDKRDNDNTKKKNEKMSEFSKFAFPGYDSNNVLFLKYPHTKIRHNQFLGLSYLHAPLVMNFYLSCIQSKKRVHMCQTVCLLRALLSVQELHNQYSETRDGGSDGEEEIRRSQSESQHNSNILSILANSRSTPSPIDQIKMNFDEYGPGLVSLFEVYDDFYSLDQLHYHGQPSWKFHGYQAMVLVGYREEHGQDYFLLHNWWEGKQYVEVSSSYLLDCRAIVHFVEEGLKFLHGDNFPVFEERDDESSSFLE